MMSLGEMLLEVGVLFIVNILVEVPAQMASHMVPREMVEEVKVVEFKFLAEVAERMR